MPITESVNATGLLWTIGGGFQAGDRDFIAFAELRRSVGRKSLSWLWEHAQPLCSRLLGLECQLVIIVTTGG